MGFLWANTLCLDLVYRDSDCRTMDEVSRLHWLIMLGDVDDGRKQMTVPSTFQCLTRSSELEFTSILLL